MYGIGIVFLTAFLSLMRVEVFSMPIGRNSEHEGLRCPSLRVTCSCGSTEVIPLCTTGTSSGNDKLGCIPCTNDTIPCSKYKACVSCRGSYCDKCKRGYTGRFCEEIVQCGIPPIIDDGYVAAINHGYWGEFSAGTIARYNCNSHYVLNGATAVYCSDAGVWVSSAPECKRKGLFGDIFPTLPPFCFFGNCPEKNSQCYAPKPSQGSEITELYHSTYHNGVYSYETVVKFKCEPGYSTVGPNPIHCNDRSEWSSQPPTCKMTYKQCPIQNVPKGLEVLPSFADSYAEGSYVYFRCNSASNIVDLFGSAVAYCLGNMTWSTQFPTCSIGCPLPTQSSDDILTFTSTTSELGVFKKFLKHGTEIEYSCKDPDRYILEGSRTATCYSSGQWNNGIPKCTQAFEM